MDSQRLKKIEETKVKLNDNVFCCKYGNGRIIDVKELTTYPILVTFLKTGNEISFTIDGKENKEDLYPTLFFGNVYKDYFSLEL